MNNPDCPECEVETIQAVRKEKVKSGNVKMAINTNVFICNQCNSEFVSEEESAKYDARVKNFHAKVNIADNKVSIH